MFGLRKVLDCPLREERDKKFHQKSDLTWHFGKLKYFSVSLKVNRVSL